MADDRCYIAVDLGAESGRVMLGTIAGGKIDLQEMHRFLTGATDRGESIRWDFARILGEIKAGIKKAVGSADAKIESISVDSWGVDFGLLDAEGQLIDEPYHYRDSRTNGMMDAAFEKLSRKEVYGNTGIQFMQLNTIYQLMALSEQNPELLAKTDKIVMMADLVGYELCGRKYCEYTLASTSQLMDMASGEWSEKIFDSLSLPISVMPDVVEPGSVVGQLKKELADEFGCEQINVVASASHDTAAAVAAVPAVMANDGKWAYLSCGTWSLLGIETPKPIINDKTYDDQFTNEGGVAGTIRLLKNIMGLWIVQECKRYWASQGEDLSYAVITEMAKNAQPFAAYIDTDYDEFLSPGDMPNKVNRFLEKTSQAKIEDKGQVVRVVLESLAMRYRQVIERFEELTGEAIDVLHVVGGGIKNELLCQFAADATGKKIVTGPTEATASGNIIMQAIAAGQIVSVAEGRELVANSFELKTYEPKNTEEWDGHYRKVMA